jgi:beta-phosphoglucomutase-like phosphatase (HAD superfamily)
MLQAIIFDFDGVIADSEPLHLRAYQEVLEQAGIELTREDYYSRYLGFDDTGLFYALTTDRHLPVTDAMLDSWIAAKAAIVERLMLRDDVIFPGAVACVQMLASNFPLAIASGALEPEIQIGLRHAGLTDSFKAIASASDGVPGKPAPDLYRLALEKLRAIVPVDAASCIAIEDSQWGLEAAKAAGLRTVAVTHTYPAARLTDADVVVHRLSDITIPQLEALVNR